MIIDDDILKCVVFIGVYQDAANFRICGSGFIYGHDINKEHVAPCYVVTAKHVIEAIKRNGAEKVWVRINTQDGKSRWMPTELSSWLLPKDSTVDAAATPFQFTADMEHLAFLDSMSYPLAGDATPQLLLGDEVFVTGLFSKHHGNDRNVPIARVGNLACTSIQEIATREFGLVKGFLIKCKSIGGLSGSPVFLHRGGKFVRNTIQVGSAAPLLLGLIHGHFDDELDADAAEDTVKTSSRSKRVNTGIAVVTPIAKVHEFLPLKVIFSHQLAQTTGASSDKPKLTITGIPLSAKF